jgi:hypothetical protein
MFACFYQLVENVYYKKINVYYYLFFLLLQMCNFFTQRVITDSFSK